MEHQMGLKAAASKGALASLIGGMAIKMIWQAGQRAMVPEEKRVASPTTDVVQVLAKKSGRELSQSQAQAAAAVFYGGTMLAYGALYGMVQSRFHPSPIAHSLLLAGIMYAANFPKSGILPKMGVLPPPQEQPVQEAAIPIVAQTAYAATTASMFNALSRA